jgi:hypothetical protein
MDIPNNSVGGGGDNVPRIRNLHPSQLSPDHPYGSIQGHDDHIPIERTMSSISERIGEFVGSYSRTSMTFMAENLAVPNGPLVSLLGEYTVYDILTYPKSNSWMMKRINIRLFHQGLFQESLQNSLCHDYPESNQDQVVVLPMNTHRYYFRILIKCYLQEVWVLWLMITDLKRILLLPESPLILNPSLTRLIS